MHTAGHTCSNALLEDTCVSCPRSLPIYRYGAVLVFTLQGLLPAAALDHGLVTPQADLFPLSQQTQPGPFSPAEDRNSPESLRYAASGAQSVVPFHPGYLAPMLAALLVASAAFVAMREHRLARMRSSRGPSALEVVDSLHLGGRSSLMLVKCQSSLALISCDAGAVRSVTLIPPSFAQMADSLPETGLSIMQQ